MPELLELWSVSERTVNRYRKQGLIAHRAAVDGRPRLIFTRRQIDRFAAAHNEQLQRASSFTRIDSELEQRLLRRARRYREALGWSLNQVAAQLAQRFQRGQETVRQVLLRHEREAGPDAIFREAGPLATRQRQVIHRAWRRGLAIETLAERFERTRSSIHRTINEQRAVLLRSLALGGPTAKTFQREDAASVLLAPEAARAGLDVVLPATAAEFLALAQRDLPDAAPEQARCAALHFLRFRAERGSATLPQHQPPAADLDRVETDLRWASRLKLVLIASHQRLAVQTIERYVERSLEALPADAVPLLYALAVRALGEAVDRHDPFKGGRLAAPASLRLTRLLAQSAARPAESLARAKQAPEAIRLPDFTAALDPWQAWLELPGFTSARMDRLAAEERAVLRRRYGPASHPPATLREAAAALDLTPQRVARLERRALRALYKKGELVSR
jgi:RNA polymerase primary sigma factor